MSGFAEDGDSARRSLLLSDLRARLEERVDRFVDDFYDSLGPDQNPNQVLARFTDSEVGSLKRRQAEHLLGLFDPDLDEDAANASAREIGRRHALVGVEIEWYAAAVGAHHEQLFGLVGELRGPDQPWVYATVARLLMADLQSALSGYRDVENAQHRVMTRLSRAVASAGTVPDLVQGVLDACIAIEGLTAGFFGRPDERDVYQFEIGVGKGALEFMAELTAREALTVTVRGDCANGQGPLGRSWRSGSVQRSDAYLSDPTTEPWHEVGRSRGWRSSVHVPVCDPQGAPRALLSFYSGFPGFFAPPARQAMLEQLKHMLERAFAGLERRGTVASAVRSHSARAAYLAKLRAGEVEMVFQPIVDLRSGRPDKVEALARLRGDHGLVMPGEFLPAFGDDELLHLFELGLDRSLEAMRSWSDQDLHVGVALNLPAASSGDERYVTAVERALRTHRTLPSRVTLELLETGYVDARPRWRGQVLEQFKSLGVRLAQDDLGSGHSSLLRLRHFAFDDVKLDQSLIRGQEFDPRGALNFIQPLTSLAHSMGLRVIVEGLENRGLIEAALMLGADAGQGYGISHPLAAAEVPAWARTHTLDLDPDHPSTHLGGLAAHVAWEQGVSAIAAGSGVVPYVPDNPCPLDGYIERIGDPSGHLAEAHASVHRTSHLGRGSTEHMRWWRVLTKMLGGRCT